MLKPEKPIMTTLDFLGADGNSAPKLWAAPDLMSSFASIPKAGGLYGWFFRGLPGVPLEGTAELDGLRLLYVGISPRKPSAAGRTSAYTLYNRLSNHFRGNAEGSTLRLTLGCLLTDELKIELRRVRSGKTRTFGPDGEARLSAWIRNNAFVAWRTHEQPWDLEKNLIENCSLPLNLQGNRHPFRKQLSQLRKQAYRTAKTLPILNQEDQPETKVA